MDRRLDFHMGTSSYMYMYICSYNGGSSIVQRFDSPKGSGSFSVGDGGV